MQRGSERASGLEASAHKRALLPCVSPRPATLDPCVTFGARHSHGCGRLYACSPPGGTQCPPFTVLVLVINTHYYYYPCEPRRTHTPRSLVRDERTHPHRPRLVVYHSTCRPLSSAPPREQLCNRSCSNKHTHPYQRYPVEKEKSQKKKNNRDRGRASA